VAKKTASNKSVFLAIVISFYVGRINKNQAKSQAVM
jgi:hypothetical protein